MRADQNEPLWDSTLMSAESHGTDVEPVAIARTIDDHVAPAIVTRTASMIGACLLVWCLGQGFVASERITFTHDVRDNSRTERIIAFELPWVVGGFVEQTVARDAVFAGVLPLKIHALNGYLSVEGGAILASAVVPRGGTHANFMARAQLRLTEHVAIAYWHWSNANLGRRNPAVDSLGITVRLHHR